MHTLDQLNAVPAEAFVTALDGVFEHAPWVAAAAAASRPFATVSALHTALMDVVNAAPEAEKLTFLRGHPALSPRALATPGLTVESRAEQTGLGMAGLGDALTRFESGSAAYEARFGIPFITCVRRMTPPFVLKGLEQRLQNTPPEEIAAALQQIAHITRLRLVDRVSGPGLPRTTGHLSTHVLDTARGKAAEGIAIDLFREGTLIKQAVTNQDGRTDEPLLSGEPLRIGRYELRFDVETYYAGWPNVTDPPWYDIIPIRFAISEPEGHYHIPLLLNAWTYSTYRGS
jgi:2-oxo-4-hydroxy-4-carboxy-5-ureidoimidazoline decarboxylase